MILVFTTCKNRKEAERIGMALLKKRLAACTVIIPKVYSAYFWPPKPPSGSPFTKVEEKIEKASEAILLVKTLKQKFPAVEREVKRLHSYRVPMIAEIPILRVHGRYLEWLKREIKKL